MPLAVGDDALVEQLCAPITLVHEQADLALEKFNAEIIRVRVLIGVVEKQPGSSQRLQLQGPSAMRSSFRVFEGILVGGILALENRGAVDQRERYSRQTFRTQVCPFLQNYCWYYFGLVRCIFIIISLTIRLLLNMK